jgi:hypothetical protein
MNAITAVQAGCRQAGDGSGVCLRTLARVCMHAEWAGHAAAVGIGNPSPHLKCLKEAC